jgi:Flp pilus assembly pilin Flp
MRTNSSSTRHFPTKFLGRANYILRHGCRETGAQDLIEYALLAAAVAVSTGAIMPGVATSICTIFSKVTSVMTAAGIVGS